MKLRLTTEGDGKLRAGYAARLWLEDVEVSKYVSKVTLICDANGGPPQARVTFWVTDRDIDLPAKVLSALGDSDESAVLGGEPVQCKRS